MKKEIRKKKRPEWDEYFLGIARLVSERSTCLRRNVGALIVKNRRILTTGYNGTPSGITHCEVEGCLREKMKIPSGEKHELCRGLHAEQNAIIQAALYGVDIGGSTLYCTNQPCSICAKMLINAGIPVKDMFCFSPPGQYPISFLCGSVPYPGSGPIP